MPDRLDKLIRVRTKMDVRTNYTYLPGFRRDRRASYGTIRSPGREKAKKKEADTGADQKE